MIHSLLILAPLMLVACTTTTFLSIRTRFSVCSALHVHQVNRLVNQTAGGDDEALPYLKTLLASEYADEALHQQDNASPYWTLLHKFAFYGCPKCADIVIKVGSK